LISIANLAVTGRARLTPVLVATYSGNDLRKPASMIMKTSGKESLTNKPLWEAFVRSTRHTSTNDALPYSTSQTSEKIRQLSKETRRKKIDKKKKTGCIDCLWVDRLW